MDASPMRPFTVKKAASASPTGTHSEPMSLAGPKSARLPSATAT